jgi:hypothetical protein
MLTPIEVALSFLFWKKALISVLFRFLLVMMVVVMETAVVVVVVRN